MSWEPLQNWFGWERSFHQHWMTCGKHSCLVIDRKQRHKKKKKAWFGLHLFLDNEQGMMSECHWVERWASCLQGWEFQKGWHGRSLLPVNLLAAEQLFPRQSSKCKPVRNNKFWGKKMKLISVSSFFFCLNLDQIKTLMYSRFVS